MCGAKKSFASILQIVILCNYLLCIQSNSSSSTNSIKDNKLKLILCTHIHTHAVCVSLTLSQNAGFRMCFLFLTLSVSQLDIFYYSWSFAVVDVDVVTIAIILYIFFLFATKRSSYQSDTVFRELFSHLNRFVVEVMLLSRLVTCTWTEITPIKCVVFVCTNRVSLSTSVTAH